MDQFGGIAIEFISVLGMPPVEFVELAADLGCRYIGLALEPIVQSKEYAAWSLRRDAGLRRDTADALRRCGVSVALGEGFIARPQRDIRDVSTDLDLMCELGVQQVNLISIDPDRGRSLAQCELFAQLAAARGLGATLEFMPGLPIGDLASAAAAIREVGRPNFRLLIDAMHFFRSGSEPAELADLGPDLIGHVQLCDVPRVSKHASYSEEARLARLPPGQGELPLLDLLAALPEDMIVGVEVPMLARAEAGLGAHRRLSECLESTRDLMRRAAALRAKG